jgi:hypothetical protein
VRGKPVNYSYCWLPRLGTGDQLSQEILIRNYWPNGQGVAVLPESGLLAATI